MQQPLREWLPRRRRRGAKVLVSLFACGVLLVVSAGAEARTVHETAQRSATTADFSYDVSDFQYSNLDLTITRAGPTLRQGAVPTRAGAVTFPPASARAARSTFVTSMAMASQRWLWTSTPMAPTAAFTRTSTAMTPRLGATRDPAMCGVTRPLVGATAHIGCVISTMTDGRSSLQRTTALPTSSRITPTRSFRSGSGAIALVASPRSRATIALLWARTRRACLAGTATCISTETCAERSLLTPLTCT